MRSIKQPVGIKAINFLKKNAPDFLDRLQVSNKNRRYDRFWQPGGGFDRNQDDPRAIHTSMEYMHNNPVRAGLVASATEWPWLSARDWAGWTEVLIHVDRTVPTWHSLG